MTDADNTASQIHFNYDALDRTDDVTQTLNTIDYTIAYNYDNQGNRTQMIYPEGKNVEYVYDNNDRLDIVKLNSVNFVDYDYGPLGRRTQKSYLAAGLPLATYNYDIADQLTNLSNTALPANAISQYAYPLYDNVGNRKQFNRTLGINPTEAINYDYNNIYELTSVTGAQTNSYDYDNSGNRVLADGIDYTPNNLNQYTDVGGTAYLYDTNGNLTSDGTNTYTYDEQSRLSTFTDSITTASYAYDPFNRRASKTVDGVTTYFIYDGDEVIAEYDGTGTLSAEYIPGPAIDEVLAMERDGNTYYYHYDGLGSVTEITDSSGALIENYEYDSFGYPSVTGSLIQNPYMFTGRRWDEESGIYYYRARMYDPSLGRFLQRDPIGYVDHMNLYQYVHNNSFNYTDPSGLIGDFHIAEAIKGLKNSNLECDNEYQEAYKRARLWEQLFWDAYLVEQADYLLDYCAKMHEWHLDVSYTGRFPGGSLNSGITFGAKLGFEGLYGYASPGIGKGAAVGISFINSRISEGGTMNAWFKGGKGIGVTTRFGVKTNNQPSSSWGIGLVGGIGASTGPRYIKPIITW